MRADDLPPLGLDDQFAEALRLPIGDWPEEILVPGHGDCAVVAGACLLLAQPNARVLGIGEAPSGNEFVDDWPMRSQHGVLGCHSAFEESTRNQHALPVYVPSGEDVRNARAEVVVHHHVPALDRHAGRGSVHEVGVAGPTHREEGRVGLHAHRVVARSVDDSHARLERLELLERPRS